MLSGHVSPVSVKTEKKEQQGLEYEQQTLKHLDTMKKKIQLKMKNKRSEGAVMSKEELQTMNTITKRIDDAKNKMTK